MQPEKTDLLSEKAYLERERSARFKSEYLGGESLAMTGASRKHNMILTNIVAELRNQLKGRPCRVYPSGMRVKVEETGMLTYPDVSVTCHDEKFLDDHLDTLLTPLVVVEVLSDSTEGYDRGAKFAHYRTIPSLEEYILVSQHHPKIERFYKNPEGRWVLEETVPGVAAIHLGAIDCTLSLSEVYDKVMEAGNETTDGRP
jgi:Uma2 family endonuclease